VTYRDRQRLEIGEAVLVVGDRMAEARRRGSDSQRAEQVLVELAHFLCTITRSLTSERKQFGRSTMP